MKIKNLMKYMMVVLFMGIGTTSVMAQKNIDKIIIELEKRSDVSINSVTKRDPKTRKIIRMVKTFVVKDPTNRFIKAFEKDEEDAITAIKELPKGRMNTRDAKLTFIFYPSKDEKRTYSLTTDKNNVVTLNIVITLGKQGDLDASDFSFYFDKDMDFEIQTINKEQMKELQKSIQKSLKGLKMKNISQLKTAHKH